MTNNKRVLVVEDISVNFEIVKILLEELGCIVCGAGNGQEAVTMARQNRYDLILMDIVMPVMDGYKATRLIKADPTCCDIPIIAMSGEQLKDCELKIRSAGFDDHTTKPVEPDDLRRIADRYLHTGSS